MLELQDTVAKLSVQSFRLLECLESQNNQLIKLMSRLRESDIRLQAERQASEEKLALQAQSEQRLQQQFENLANKIFDSKTDHSNTSDNSLQNHASGTRVEVGGSLMRISQQNACKK